MNQAGIPGSLGLYKNQLQVNSMRCEGSIGGGLGAWGGIHLPGLQVRVRLVQQGVAIATVLVPQNLLQRPFCSYAQSWKQWPSNNAVCNGSE